MPLTPEQIEAIKRMGPHDPAKFEEYSRMTPAERFAVANEMWRAVRDKLRNQVRASHPDWTDDAIHREAGRRMLDGET